jgi:hypothetical protein
MRACLVHHHISTWIRLAGICCLLLMAGCDDRPWNRPYPAGDASRNIYYASFSERPNHLDPAQSSPRCNIITSSVLTS